MFFTFVQNNVHGDIVKNENVAEYVIIEADNSEKANEKATLIGIDESDYCECCGWRWVDAEDKNGTINPTVKDITDLENYKDDFYPSVKIIIYYDNGKKTILTCNW
ncbi:MAG: hypothetical protein RL755_68 [Pseudomonadota bacterium]|jgi:hypothetical protein